VWVYKNCSISNHNDLLSECTDIVYIISYTNGQQYIGKKAVRAIRKKPPLKNKKRNRRILTNLPFVNYEGSHDLAGSLEISKKEILYQCNSRKTATYLEAALLFHYDAIFDPHWLNENILGKFYSNSLKGILEIL